MGRPVLVYQGTCRFCCVVTSVVLAWDRKGRLRPVALETAEAEELLAGIGAEARARSWHLVNAEGELFSAGFAFSELFSLLPGGRPFGVLAGTRPEFTQAAYAAVASRRGAIGRVLPEGVVRRACELISARAATGD